MERALTIQIDQIPYKLRGPRCEPPKRVTKIGNSVPKRFNSINLKMTETPKNVWDGDEKLFVCPVAVTVKLGRFCFDVKRPS